MIFVFLQSNESIQHLKFIYTVTLARSELGLLVHLSLILSSFLLMVLPTYSHHVAIKFHVSTFSLSKQRNRMLREQPIQSFQQPGSKLRWLRRCIAWALLTMRRAQVSWWNVELPKNRRRRLRIGMSMGEENIRLWCRWLSQLSKQKMYERHWWW